MAKQTATPTNVVYIYTEC